MRFLATLGIACALIGPVAAAEPDGCDKFKWPIAADRAALTAPDLVTVQSGSTQTIAAKAVTLALAPIGSAKLPMPPERKRTEDGSAGYLRMAAPEKPASATLSMNLAVWIDVIQDGKYLKPTAFSGATGCDGIRKTMRFDLAAQPFVVQVSGGAEPAIALLIKATD